MPVLKTKTVKIIEVGNWDKLVQDTYKKPYSFQQQDGWRERGFFRLSIPSEYTHNNSEMCVNFSDWLKRDTEYDSRFWWHRVFYPDIYTLANDLHEKGLIEAGEYYIEIDW